MTCRSPNSLVDAQDGHFGRGGQDFAKRMHPLAGIRAPELIELVEILHLDLELQGRPAVTAGVSGISRRAFRSLVRAAWTSRLMKSTARCRLTGRTS
jgi:hypothetical protein